MFKFDTKKNQTHSVVKNYKRKIKVQKLKVMPIEEIECCHVYIAVYEAANLTSVKREFLKMVSSYMLIIKSSEQTCSKFLTDHFDINNYQ